MTNFRASIVFAFAAALSLVQVAFAADAPVTVNVDNFARAEADMQFRRIVKIAGGVNKWMHFRLPTPIDKQNVIRMNRDTLYSFAIVDISKGATLTMPHAGKRYMSVLVINNNGYVNKVFHGGGTYKLTTTAFGTRFVGIGVRTLVNSADDADIEAVHALQNKMTIKSSSARPFVMPNYDMASYQSTKKPLLELVKGVTDTRKMFGKKADVTEVRFLMGSAFGWGGLPSEEAIYLNVAPNLPVGKYQVTVKDVPVDAFWSISLYNKDGYFQKNEFSGYSVNNITGKPNKDGSFTVNFGDCKAKRVNCLPIMDGWNYIVRLYQPRKAIRDGKWTFPAPQPVKE